MIVDSTCERVIEAAEKPRLVSRIWLALQTAVMAVVMGLWAVIRKPILTAVIAAAMTVAAARPLLRGTATYALLTWAMLTFSLAGGGWLFATLWAAAIVAAWAVVVVVAFTWQPLVLGIRLSWRML